MSREELVKNFNDVMSMGYEHEEIKEYDYEERTLKLSDDLCLCLFDSENYMSPEISMVKTLPDSTDVHYHNSETLLNVGRFQGTNISAKEDKIFLNLTPYNFEGLEKDGTLKELKEIESSRYSAKYEYSHLLPVQLYKFTSNEFILNHFSKNTLVDIFDLPLETI